MAKKKNEEKEKNMDKKQIALIGIAIAIIGAVFLVIFNGKVAREVTLKIDCNGKDLSGTYKEGKGFTCNLLDTDYKLNIKKITDDKVVLGSDVGLTPVRENNDLALSSLGIEPIYVGDITETVGVVTTSGIDLMTEYREFEVEKGKILKLTIQATDVVGSYYLTISWE